MPVPTIEVSPGGVDGVETVVTVATIEIVALENVVTRVMDHVGGPPRHQLIVAGPPGEVLGCRGGRVTSHNVVSVAAVQIGGTAIQPIVSRTAVQVAVALIDQVVIVVTTLKVVLAWPSEEAEQSTPSYRRTIPGREVETLTSFER